MSGQESARDLVVAMATRNFIDASRNAADAARILAEALALVDDEQPERPTLRVLSGGGRSAGRHCRLMGIARHLRSAP